MSSQDNISQFCVITGCQDEPLAKSLLEACGGNLEMAVNMHMEGIDNNARNGQASTSGEGAGPVQNEAEEDGVRAPIPQKQETLIEPGYEGYVTRPRENPHRNRIRSVFDGFRNFGNETYDGNVKSNKKRKALEDLFKPPIDLLFKGSWNAAREAATKATKWLLVNIQDPGEFQCQVLNRDVWSNEAVKTIIREHFVFWQQYKESEEATRFLTFYPSTDWPYVCVVDPRTGEKLATWSRFDAESFCDLVADFLSTHKDMNQAGGAAAEPPIKKGRRDSSILDADEDAQMAAAIRASLEAAAAKKPDTDESELEFTDDDSTAPPTPVKRASRTVSPEPTKPPLTKIESPSSDVANSADKTQNGADWESYLGSEGDEQSSIIIRLPDGTKEVKQFPSSSKLMAVLKYVVHKGFPLERYDIVTNFPRRILTTLDEAQTLKDHGLFPQETVFIQQR